MSILENIYQGYKLARNANEKANEISGKLNDVKMAGQGVGYGTRYALVRDPISEKKVVDSFQYFVSKNKLGQVTVVLYNVFERKDAASLSKMVDLLNTYLSKTPIGKLMMNLYKPHFSLLIAVAEEVEKGNKQLKDLDVIEQQLGNFKNEANRIIHDTEFNIDEYQGGPFRLLAYLASRDTTTGTSDTAGEFCIIVIKMIERLISDLDRMLTYYVKLSRNYKKLVDEARNEGKGLVGQAVGGIVYNRIQLSGLQCLHNIGSRTTIFDQLEQLIKNRNDWANWLGRPIINEVIYYKMPLS